MNTKIIWFSFTGLFYQYLLKSACWSAKCSLQRSTSNWTLFSESAWFCLFLWVYMLFYNLFTISSVKTCVSLGLACFRYKVSSGISGEHNLLLKLCCKIVQNYINPSLSSSSSLFMGILEVLCCIWIQTGSLLSACSKSE